MNNEIEKKRADIQQYFDKNGRIDEPSEVYQSKSELYYIQTERYLQNDPIRNWIVTKISIHHKEQPDYVFEYLTDNDDTSFEWLQKDGKEYLLLPELQGGQSIFDVLAQKLYSCYSIIDPFIWIDIYPSPNKTKFAVLGCYWGYPWEIKIYDCSKLVELPYPSIAIDRDSTTDLEFKEWANDDFFIVFDKEKQEKIVKTIKIKP
jgi:hypothetical protein